MNRHRTYRPQPPQIPADPLRGNPCDSRDPRSHVPPLKGLRETLTASVSYRASVPAGHAYCEVAPSHRALSPAADRQNRSSKALSGKGSAPAPPPPFRHTPFRPRPRHIATVWRNPGRHPHRDESFTFSAKEKDSETGLSYFGSRYYSSDLGIWLSVDPQSDKYPSLSPYTYCANNPVKLVDPNGETWETPEDIDLANTLISHAQTMQSTYDPSSFEYQLLQEGINGLINMGSDENTCYTFNNSQTYEGSVSLLDNGTISINYVDIEGEPDSKIGSAWHEAFHLMRRNTYRSYSEDELRNASTTYWGFKNGLLGNNNNINEEYLTYTSQLIFSPKSMPTNEGAKVVDDASIRNYIIKHYGCPSDYVFQFPAP